jgi:hypothetical protein
VCSFAALAGPFFGVPSLTPKKNHSFYPTITPSFPHRFPLSGDGFDPAAWGARHSGTNCLYPLLNAK